jgi:hypothetical protein
MIGGQPERRAGLRRAIERLPLLPGVNVESATDALQIGCFSAGVNELPRMKSSRKKNGAAVEMEKFARLASKLRFHLNSMSREGLNSLARDGERCALAVDCDLEKMLHRAAEALTAAQPSPASTSPRRLAPEQTAQICAQMYEDLTSKRARVHWNDVADKSGGPFLRFVEDVFAACGIKASAEHYAKAAEGHVGKIGGNGGATFERVPRKPA